MSFNNHVAADVDALRAVLPQLSERDQDFAGSLIAQFAERGLSDKQIFWVRKLAATAAPAPVEAPAAPAPTDLKPIVALFATAGGQRAVVKFRTAEGTVYRLSLAGPSSSAPGSLNVTDDNGGFDSRAWFGRVTVDGRFLPSRSLGDRQVTQVRAALVAFAFDPAGAAAAFGHATGCCCFCSHELTDERSVRVGYGPICASSFGLPWGTELVAEAVEAAS